MGTSIRFKPENNCLKCGKSVIYMTREQQDEHILMHELEEIEQKKQQKLF